MCLGKVQIYVAQLMPLPLAISCSVNPDWYVYLPGFTLLVLAHPGSPRKNPESRKMVIVVVVL